MHYSSCTFVKIVVLYSVLIQLVTGDDKTPSTSPQVTIAPHCTSKCGNVTIPYPFGIEEGCYYMVGTEDTNSSFHIKCNNNTNSPIPYFGRDYYDVSKISIVDGEIRTISDVAFECYDESGHIDGYKAVLHLDPFTLSRNKNILVTIGCDTTSWFYGERGNKPHETESVARCVDLEDVIDGECNGVGCSQMSFPDGITFFAYDTISQQNHSWAYKFNPCGVAFPIAKDAFRFDPAILSRDFEFYTNNNITVPIVVNWTITGQGNCSTAKSNGSMLCGQNTECDDPQHEHGYRCKCKPGFSGNPYLPQGCKDIDECKGTNDCEKPKYCINTVGGHYCKCPKGYHGNGTITDPCAYSMKPWVIPVLATAGPLGTIILLLVGCWFYLFIKRRRVIKQRQTNFEKNGGMLLRQQMSSDEGVIDRIKIFTIDELNKATDNFNEDRILGQGGHGTVYKGMLGEGRIVAVKKSNILEECQCEEFINEVVIMSQLSHRSILKLLGCCLETEVPLLVYEFILNGTLFHHIHHPSEDFSISWKMRLQIASDTAGALAYLHSSTSTLIFHRDIKSSNILLDDKYRAKLSDFGTSRSVGIDQTHVVTRVMGTLGYLDPEYFQSQQFTEKSDVYSFGVVLVELLTGQKAVRAVSEQDRSLTSWFLSHMENSCLLEIVDSQVLQEGSKEEFFKIADLAKRCLHLDGKKRPTMKEVLVEIEIVLSFHISQAHHPNNTTKFEQASDGITTITTKSNTFNLESRALDSGELSLLYNSR